MTYRCHPKHSLRLTACSAVALLLAMQASDAEGSILELQGDVHTAYSAMLDVVPPLTNTGEQG